jgi:hypothetical protein
MANNGGHTDTDMGMIDAFAEMEKLKSMCVKVGITEDVGAQQEAGSATLAQIAAWNELGVMGPPMSQHGAGKWFIPPRPFVRGFADGKREQIAKTLDNLCKLVSLGKMTAEIAMAKLGEFAQSGIKSYIRTGQFTPNADSTIAKKKGKTRPLMDTGTLRNSIRYQVLQTPVNEVR